MNRATGWIQGLMLLLAVASCTIDSKGSDAMPQFGDDEMGNLPQGSKVIPRAWSAAGTLTAKNNLTNQNNQDQVSLQQVFEDPGMYTVSVEADLAADSLVQIRPTVEVAWSVGGNTLHRRMTVAQAASMSQNAEGVIVKVTDQSLLLGGVNTTYKVRATVSKGVRPAIQRPTLVSREGPLTIAAGGFQVYVLPVKAGIVACSVNVAKFAGGVAPIPDQSVTMFQQVVGGGAGNISQAGYRDFEWWSMFPGTGQILILNSNAFAIVADVLYAIDG